MTNFGQFIYNTYLDILIERLPDGHPKYNGFNLHWPGEKRRAARVLIIIRKNLINRIVIKKRSDLIDHPYLIVLNIGDFNQKTRIPIRRIKVINIYNQIIGREYTQLGAYLRKRRAMEDISQNKIIIERTIFISDFNAHNSKQNSIYENSIKARSLEALLTKFSLIIINEEGVLIKRLLEKIFIIDLTIISPSRQVLVY